jgi:hypothetical protein
MHVNATLMDLKITEVNSKTQAEQQCALSTTVVNDKFKMSRGNAVDL